jgi:hypothetical protein
VIEKILVFKHRKPGAFGQIKDWQLCHKRLLWNTGIMECWNTGFIRNEINFYFDGLKQEIKSGHHPLFRPNIPFFHHSIIPMAT